MFYPLNFNFKKDIFAIILNQADITYYNGINNPQNGKYSTLYIVNFKWLGSKQNIILTGEPQSGKTTILAYIFNNAVNLEMKAFFYPVPYLLQHIINPVNRYSKGLTNHLKTADLLLLDDFCTFRMNAKESDIFLEILKARNGLRPTVLASQHPTEKWKEIIDGRADEITNLLLEDAIKVNLKPFYEIF